MSELSYSTDHSDPAKEVSSGMHTNTADTPVSFAFAVDSVKGASAATIKVDICTYLGTQGRTDYDPDQAYEPGNNHKGPIITDSTGGTRVFQVQIHIDGGGDPFIVFDEVTA